MEAVKVWLWWKNLTEFLQKQKGTLVFWENSSKWDASASKVVTANVISWKQLSTFSGIVLCILQSETCLMTRPKSNSQVFVFITATSLLMVCFTRPVCQGSTECKSLVSIYWVLCIAGFTQHVWIFMKNSVL